MLHSALTQARDALSGVAEENEHAYAGLVEELFQHVETAGREGADARFAESIAAMLEADPDRRDDLADVVGSIAYKLAPDDIPPSTPDGAAAFRALISSADRLYGAGVKPLGRLPFISDRLLTLMVAEARVALPDRPDSDKRLNGEPGRALATLAVSRKLVRAMEAALGFAVAPVKLATYMYDPPGSHVRTHVDNRPYELIFHLILEHDVPADSSPGSALVTHLPGQAEPVRTWLRPGEAVALSGRGTIHSWQKLGPDERRTLIGIGFERAPLTS